MLERGSDARARWAAWVEGALPGRSLVEPPEGVVRLAVALGAGLARRPAPGGWLVKLLFDSFAAPLPAGVRTAAATERRLLYEIQRGAGDTAAAQLDLRVRRERGGRVQLAGQLLPPWSGARVAVTTPSGRTTRRLGTGGDFMIGGLAAKTGAVTLEFRGADGERLTLTGVPLLATPGEAE